MFSPLGSPSEQPPSIYWDPPCMDHTKKKPGSWEAPGDQQGKPDTLVQKLHQPTSTPLRRKINISRRHSHAKQLPQTNLQIIQSKYYSVEGQLNHPCLWLQAHINHWVNQQWSLHQPHRGSKLSLHVPCRSAEPTVELTGQNLNPPWSGVLTPQSVRLSIRRNMASGGKSLQGRRKT